MKHESRGHSPKHLLGLEPGAHVRGAPPSRPLLQIPGYSVLGSCPLWEDAMTSPGSPSAIRVASVPETPLPTFHVHRALTSVTEFE